MSSDLNATSTINTVLCNSDLKNDKNNSIINNNEDTKQKNNKIRNNNKQTIIIENYVDSLTSENSELLNILKDEYNINNENIDVNKPIHGSASFKTGLNNINGDEVNKQEEEEEINKQNDNKNANQKCRGQKEQFCLGRRDLDSFKGKTGWDNINKYDNHNVRSNRIRRGIFSMLQVLLAVIFYNLLMVERVSGGICWASMQRKGGCKELIAENISREECCSSGQSPGTAWSSEDYDSGHLFFWRVLGGGAPCNICRETCDGVKCGNGRRCAIRKGRPRCICAPRCGGGRGGPVCGTDGKTYRSLCRLKKRACRRRTRDLMLDYYGHCQDTCNKIRCAGRRHCVLDQNSRAHCVKCIRSCPRPHHSEHTAKAVCGADGKTYPSPCHLQVAACRKGKSIPMAYRGPCNVNATCETIRCQARQACLVDWRTDMPHCVSCGARCPRAKRTLCATNNRTYSSWCHMLRDACITGYVLETKHAGMCKTGDLNDSNAVSNEEDKFE